MAILSRDPRVNNFCKSQHITRFKVIDDYDVRKVCKVYGVYVSTFEILRNRRANFIMLTVSCYDSK